jgi:hypothetical protein
MNKKENPAFLLETAHILILAISLLFSNVRAEENKLKNYGLEKSLSEYYAKKFEIRNRYISFTVSGNGLYTFGAEKNSLLFEGLTEMDMTFGHPNGFAFSDMGSSQTSLKIDGKYYNYHLNREEPVFHADPHAVSCIKTIDDISINQTICLGLNPESNLTNIFRIQYSLSNQSRKPKRVSLKILLDTWAGSNDGVPFRILKFNEESIPEDKEIVMREKELEPKKIDYWETYETKTTKLSMICFGKMLSECSPRPDKVQFVKWTKGFQEKFDIAIDTNESITGDSAVAIYWTNHLIQPGKTRFFEFVYGIRVYDQDGVFYPRTIDVNNNPFSITVTKYNPTDLYQKYLIWVDKLPDYVTSLNDNNQSVSFTVEPRRERTMVFSFLASPQAPEKFVIPLKFNDDMQIKQLNCTIENKLRKTPVTVLPFVQQGKPIVARFDDVESTVKENHYLIAKLFDKNGIIIEKIVLYDDGQHNDEKTNDSIYANTFKSRPKEGDYKVQVVMVKHEKKNK